MHIANVSQDTILVESYDGIQTEESLALCIKYRLLVLLLDILNRHGTTSPCI